MDFFFWRFLGLVCIWIWFSLFLVWWVIWVCGKVCVGFVLEKFEFGIWGPFGLDLMFVFGFKFGFGYRFGVFWLDFGFGLVLVLGLGLYSVCV